MTDRNLRVSALVGFGVTLALVVVTFSIGGLHIFERTYTLSAVFASADEVTSGDPVRVAGVDVGSVTSVARRPDGVGMKLRIRRNVGLSQATRASIRLRTLLGKKFVDLVDPGTGPVLKAGFTIPRARTTSATEVDTLLNAAKPVVQHVDVDSFNRMARSFDLALNGRAPELRTLLAGLDNLAGRLAERKDDIDRLIAATSVLSQAVDSRQGALTASIDNFAVVLDTLAARRAELSGLVSGVKGLSAQLTPLLKRNSTTIDTIVNDVLETATLLDSKRERLDLALDQLPDVVDALYRVTNQGSWVNVYIVGIGATPYLSNPVNLGDADGLEPGRDGGLPRLWLQPPAQLPSADAAGVTVDSGDHSPPRPSGYPS